MVEDSQQVRKAIRNVLDDNIDDPITKRELDGKNWIYTDFPRLDATMPRIGMDLVDTSYSSLAVGTPVRVKNDVVQVTIMVHEDKNSFDIDGDGETESEEKLLMHLANRVEEVIVDNQKFLRDEYDLRYVLPLDSTTTRRDDSKIIQKNIDFEVEYV